MLLLALRGFWRGPAHAWDGDARLGTVDPAAHAEGAGACLDRAEAARDRAALSAPA
jgi:hypothetical protein